MAEQYLSGAPLNLSFPGGLEPDPAACHHRSDHWVHPIGGTLSKQVLSSPKDPIQDQLRRKRIVIFIVNNNTLQILFNSLI